MELHVALLGDRLHATAAPLPDLQHAPACQLLGACALPAAGLDYAFWETEAHQAGSASERGQEAPSAGAAGRDLCPETAQ